MQFISFNRGGIFVYHVHYAGSLMYDCVTCLCTNLMKGLIYTESRILSLWKAISGPVISYQAVYRHGGLCLKMQSSFIIFLAL